jgi:hypothetical protein
VRSPAAAPDIRLSLKTVGVFGPQTVELWCQLTSDVEHRGAGPFSLWASATWEDQFGNGT